MINSFGILTWDWGKVCWDRFPLCTAVSAPGDLSSLYLKDSVATNFFISLLYIDNWNIIKQRCILFHKSWFYSPRSWFEKKSFYPLLGLEDSSQSINRTPRPTHYSSNFTWFSSPPHQEGAGGKELYTALKYDLLPGPWCSSSAPPPGSGCRRSANIDKLTLKQGWIIHRSGIEKINK